MTKNRLTVETSKEIPKPNLQRYIWQPITDTEGQRMRLAPLSWQPSGAWAALEYLAAERDFALARAETLESLLYIYSVSIYGDSPE